MTTPSSQQPTSSASSAEQRDIVAKAIYDAFEYTGAGSKPSWWNLGNSQKQDEARRYAEAALSATVPQVVQAPIDELLVAPSPTEQASDVRNAALEDALKELHQECGDTRGRLSGDYLSDIVMTIITSLKSAPAAKGNAQDVIERECKDCDALLTLLAKAREAAQPRVDLTDERAAFEAWCKENDLKTDRFSRSDQLNGEYFYQSVVDAWNAWQARAALANTAQGKPRSFCADCGKRMPEGSIHTCAPAYAVEQADHIVDANKMVENNMACSVCYGTGADVSGMPCMSCRKFAPTAKKG